MPYYGCSEYTSHSVLNVLFQLCAKSPTYKGCENDINNFAFSRRVMIQKAETPGLALPENEVKASAVNSKRYTDALSKIGIPLTVFSRYSRECESHKKQSGNAYLKVQVFQEGDTFKVFFKAIHYKKAALLATKPTEIKQLIVVTDWDLDVLKLDGNKPQFYPVSDIETGFNWKEKKGLWETVVHLKTEGNDESDWYGRPDILTVLEWMFSETAQADHSCKVNSVETTTKDIFAFKQEDYGNDAGGDDDMDDNFNNTAKSLREITTTEGNTPSSLAMIEYQEEAPTHYQMNVNRDTNWFESQSNKAIRTICQVMGWSAELLGATESKSGIGSDKILNLFATKNSSTIEPLQEEYENLWLAVLSEIGRITNQPVLGEFQIKFKNKVESLIESLGEKSKMANATNTITGK